MTGSTDVLSTFSQTDFVEFGVSLAAATIFECQVNDPSVLMTPAVCNEAAAVQFWIPLEHGVKAVYMNFKNVAAQFNEAQFMSTLQKLMDGEPHPELSLMSHDDAKTIFKKQNCSLTVDRLNILNQSAHYCWRVGSYYGLLLPKQKPVATGWFEAAGAAPMIADVSSPVLPTKKPTLQLHDFAKKVKFVFPEAPVGGVLIYPADAVFLPEDHLQVLKIVLNSHRQGMGSFSIPPVDAEFVAESEMRFSARIYDFATQFAERYKQGVEARGGPVKNAEDGSLRGSMLLVTGPSASGKTTFANRLVLALRAFGFAPLTVSMDEYYRDSKVDPNYPRNPDGTPNHELVECLNLDQLKEDVNTLLTYGQVELPQFDMVNSKPKPKTGQHMVSFPRNSIPILILEGIFALHPTWVKKLEGENITKLFVMPVATRGVTELVTIPNQTARLIRRISRDFLHRGRNARASIARVPGVQKGEDEGIFPLLRHANFVFNTFIDFEVGLLRVYVAPLLRQIEPTDKTYTEGQYLLSLLEGIQSVSDRSIGKDSLVREFIGGSLFEMEQLATHFDNRAGQLLGKRFSFSKSIPNLFNFRHHKQVCDEHIPCILDALLKQLASEASMGSPGSDEDEAEAKREKPANDALLSPDEVLAVMNNRAVVSLHLPLEGSDYFHGADLRPLKMSSAEGLAAYDRTAIFMLHVAVKQVLGMHHRLVVLHRFVEEGDRYCVRVQDGETIVPLTPTDRDDIMKAFDDLIREDHKILLRYASPAAAVELFLRHHMTYAVRLLESSTRPKVLLANLAGIPTLCLLPLLPSTKYIVQESVTFDPADGCVAQAVQSSSGDETMGFAEWTFTIGKGKLPSSPELDEPQFSSQRTAMTTAATVEVCKSRMEACTAHRLFCIGDVNNAVFAGQAASVVSVDDSLQFKILYNLLHRIQSSEVRVVFIAGSSSGGKSVISSQLRQLLDAHGYVTSSMATDDYYRDLSDPSYPLFPNGSKNTESVEALKLELLGQHLRQLAFGGEDVVDGPAFDCGKGLLLPIKRFHKALPAEGKSVLIVEGLFALSPAIHALFDDKTLKTLKVMVHPMPLLNLDELNLVSATQLRLLRRCVRDYYVRGRTAKETLERRKMVMDGEVLNTLNFVEEADVIVNASCVYELSALRSTAEMLLNYVPDSLTDGGDAVRCAMELKEFISWICGMPESRLPARRFVQMLVDPNEGEAAE